MQMLKTARRANEFLTFSATSRVYSCSVKRKDRCEGCPSGQKAFYGLWKTRLESHQQSPPIGYHTKVCLPTCSLKDCTHALLLRHDCQRWNGLSCPDNESNIWLKVWCNWGPYFPRYKIGIAEAVWRWMEDHMGVKGCFWSTVGDTLYVLERQRLRTQDSEDRIPFITELDQWPYGPWVKGETVKQLVCCVVDTLLHQELKWVGWVRKGEQSGKMINGQWSMTVIQG